MYKEFITQLHIHAKANRILAKGYSPISLIAPIKLKRHFRSSENYCTENHSRLQFDYKNIISIL